MQGDLTDLASMHHAIDGCARIYFGMSVSATYLEATVNTAAVARHHGVEAFVNMSQMTVTLGLVFNRMFVSMSYLPIVMF